MFCSELGHERPTTGNEGFQLGFELVPIDSNFVDEFVSTGLSIPYMKAGDLIFVALAKARKAIFVTEDEATHMKAREAGACVYQIEQFLEEFAT